MISRKNKGQNEQTLYLILSEQESELKRVYPNVRMLKDGSKIASEKTLQDPKAQTKYNFVSQMENFVNQLEQEIERILKS